MVHKNSYLMKNKKDFQQNKKKSNKTIKKS